MASILTVVDEERGCGWRKEGGLYLMGGGWSIGCGRLPLALERCPTCDRGIKPGRGWTWVDPRPLFPAMTRAGLLWIGGQFYPTPAAFLAEADRLGISRRIAAVPKGLEIGKTWVLLAHRKAIYPRVGEWIEKGTVLSGEPRPGIFHVFRPDRIEYVVKGSESQAELDALEKRGLTLVRIERAGQRSLAAAGVQET